MRHYRTGTTAKVNVYPSNVGVVVRSRIQRGCPWIRDAEPKAGDGGGGAWSRAADAVESIGKGCGGKLFRYIRIYVYINV